MLYGNENVFYPLLPLQGDQNRRENNNWGSGKWGSEKKGVTSYTLLVYGEKGFREIAFTLLCAG